jgi:hypothetical protein
VRTLLAGAALAAAAALAATPAAATPLRPVASADVRIDRDVNVGLESDGQRWYAYQARRGSVVAVDSRSGRRVKLAPPQTCVLEDLRLSLVLLSCGTDPVARLVSLPGRAVTDFADLDGPGGRPFADAFTAVGRYWLGGGTCDTGGHCAQVYLNRRTHERVLVDDSEAEDPDVLLGDVDTPGPRVQDGTIRVDARSGGYRLTQRVETNAPLVLAHRGRSRTLRRCRTPCRFATLGGRLVTWAQGRVAYAYDVRSHKTAHWRVPVGKSSGAFVTALVHTAGVVLVRTYEHQEGSLVTREVLYRASVPKLR